MDDEEDEEMERKAAEQFGHRMFSAVSSKLSYAIPEKTESALKRRIFVDFGKYIFEFFRTAKIHLTS